MKHGRGYFIGATIAVVLAAALALLATGGEGALAQGTIIYVDADATGANNGASWTDAFLELQSALNVAGSGDQIWVAAGTYKPRVTHGGIGDRFKSFQLLNGVAIYGGFDPSLGHDTWEERDWANNAAILSGDIGIAGKSSDNSYHVFFHPASTNLDSTAVLDGFTISGGNANGSAYPHWEAGGMWNDGSSPTLANCTFSDNSADDMGGGLFNNNGSSPTITNCTFIHNSAFSGGAMVNYEGSAPVLTDCTFAYNSADHYAGVINSHWASPVFANCTFEGNSAVYNGGGMGNSSSSPVLIDCTFEGNSAGSRAGGMYDRGNSSSQLINVAFVDNSAFDGGGMFVYQSSPVLSNCIFWANQATQSAGGMYNYDSSSPVLTNCTFTGNHAAYTGGMVNQSASNAVVTNCILWGDTDTIGNVEISNPNSTPVVTYSDVQGGYAGVGNIDVDPLFVDAYNGDLHLGTGSPCVDAGNNAAPNLPLRDFDGDPRIMDGDSNGTPVVDMGVDELWVPPPSVIYVDQDATGINSGTSWAHAFTDLQLALDWAVAGVEIWVAEGTYKPTVAHGGVGDRFKSFHMVNGVAIYGGFDPSVGDVGWGDRDWVGNVTVLSGDLNGDDVPPFTNNGENSYHVFFHPWEVALDSSAILDGFTITGGNANLAPDDSLHNRGGGMGNFGASPTVVNCIFEGNSASYRGGGMFNNTASPVVTSCSFSGNHAGKEGGGMSNWASSPTVTACTFEDNSADLYGGGMRNAEGSAPTVIDCTFEGNSASDRGGGMINIESSPQLSNSTFSGNSAEYGGGMVNDSSSPTLSNITFTSNAGPLGGGGMYNLNGSSPSLITCAFVSNSGYHGGGLYNWNSAPTLTDCTFSSNAAIYGGGMSNVQSSSVLVNCAFTSNFARDEGGGIRSYGGSLALTNCTFWGNSTNGTGGGISNAGSSPTVTNCILWGDTAGGLTSEIVGGSAVVTYSDVQGGYSGQRNIHTDPLFVDAANGDLHLGTGSPCIDVGNNAAPDLPPYDFEGDPRVLDGDGDLVAVVDMGVDEAPGEIILTPIEVEIDITPNTPSNIIRLSSPAKVPVAILTTSNFNTADVAPDTVLFAGAAHAGYDVQDVDGDGADDLLLYFYPADMVDLTLSSRTATLTGETVDGQEIEGTDKVKVKE